MDCQRLALDLTATHEGVEHVYHPFGDDGDDEMNANVQDVATLLVSPNFEGNLGIFNLKDWPKKKNKVKSTKKVLA